MLGILNFVRRIAESEATTVLLDGENGTGKDLIAKILHDQSQRQAEPFIAVNLAAIPEALLESELFGYEKGAFTSRPLSGSAASSNWRTGAHSSWMRLARSR